jgi:acetyltransferase-like isoleucine patch superfamily enzyme
VPPVCLTTLDTSPGGILSLDGILDLAAEADPAQIGVIASLLRLLTEDVLRLLVAELARCPVYPQLFEYLRQHLGKQAPFLWGTTTDIALDFWIRNCGYEVGRHTYGAPTIWSGLLFKETTKLTIGKYCAIAGNIDLVMANHRTRWVSTYPFAILRSFWPGFDGTESDYVAKPIVIGNDVWIGAHCCILPGSQVGDGAVLAAYSQVRGVVPPYAIYSGNPGRVVGYRFSESIIARLLAIRWWNWPDWKVDAFLPLMMSADIQRFIDAAEADVAGHAPHETAAPRPLANTPPNAAEDPLAAIGAVARRLQDYGDPAMREIGHALVMIQLQLAGLQPRGGGLFRFWRRQRRN